MRYKGRPSSDNVENRSLNNVGDSKYVQQFAAPASRMRRFTSPLPTSQMINDTGGPNMQDLSGQYIEDNGLPKGDRFNELDGALLQKITTEQKAQQLRDWLAKMQAPE